MPSDIVERLLGFPGFATCQEAADTITTLRAENERLRAALEPFAKALKGNWSAQPDSMAIVAGPHGGDLRLEFTLADFRRAAALAEEKKG